MKHLSNLRKRKRCDSVSSGERKRNSLNRRNLFLRGCGTSVGRRIPKFNSLERLAIERDSRLNETKPSLEDIPSNAMHVKLRMNQSGPPDKAKYSSVTDSELVP